MKLLTLITSLILLASCSKDDPQPLNNCGCYFELENGDKVNQVFFELNNGAIVTAFACDTLVITAFKRVCE